MNNKVVVIKTEEKYPEYPYNPDKVYPEFKGVPGFSTSSISNPIYDSVRNLIFYLGLDKENFGKENWNPFGMFVKKGGTVLIKPNWVRDYNPINKKNIESLVTHTSIIKPILDYLLKAINYNGKIIIADAPLQSCDFDNLIAKTKIKDLINEYKQLYKNVDFILEDWRLTIMEKNEFLGLKTAKQKIKEISNSKYRIIDLKNKSFLEEISDYFEDFRVTCYNHKWMLAHHKRGQHEYLVTNRIFEADLIINIPKLKTHIKAGLTGALKNLVGINGHKEFLPHHIKGSYLEGGDNYINPSFWKKIYENFDEKIWSDINKKGWFNKKIDFLILGILWKIWNVFSKDKVIAGSWAGNETIWRTTLDLNHILYFYSPEKNKIENNIQRNVITIVDGIIAGEGNGPLTPLDKKLGILIGGFNPAIIDAVISKIIGYNISRIPTVYNALFNVKSKFAQKEDEIFIEWIENGTSQIKNLKEIKRFNFIPPRYWERAISDRTFVKNLLKKKRG